MIETPYLVTPGKKLDLSRRRTSETGRFAGRANAQRATERHLEHLRELQEVLYAEAKHAVLVVFQAMDAGGKDGAIRSIFSGVNPQGCQVTSFKVPTPLELAHDFLWRIHLACPPKGMIGIFNRSHYESVLVERVKQLAPEKVWRRRFEHICEFERMLADEGTTIVKFYLHISEEEQKCRLQSRLDDPEKNWKFNPGDLAERARWDDYMAAFEEALEKTSTSFAPWYVVPSDKKWYRNHVIAHILARTLKNLDMKYPPPAQGLDRVKII
jgi:PPK2 family polyphosphate:nucleotide phosphotransferase